MLNKKALAAARIASGTTTDADFENVTMLLHGDGTNGAQNNTFIDGSTNNFTVTRNGNVTQGSLNPFGDRWSNYFDGTGDYLTLPTSTGFTMGTGAFTLEAWFWLAAGTTGGIISALRDNFTPTYNVGIYISAGLLRFAASTNSTPIWNFGTSAFSMNQWTHVVGVRDSGSNVAFFVNGTRVASSTNNGDIAGDSFAIGTHYIDNPTRFPLNGYISNARIIKGAAAYNPTLTTITVPTAPLTAVTNTQLLTCQSNRFIDNSSNNFTITRNGDVSVRPFSPFSPSAAYSTSTNGGSGYFDGAGDYLSISSSSSLTLSGDYTLEAWIYPIDVSTAYKRIFQNVPGTTPSGFYYVYLWGTQVRMYNADNTALGTNLGEFVPRAWFHLAICRSGSTTRIFINGSQTSTITGSTTFTNNGWFVGGGPSSEFNNVYVSSHRLVVGTAVYTANFTPPTAPLTAITNTSLLLNFTNGGIIDNAADNVLETVGNAQISTSVKKYGTGSLAFDGTGDWLLTPDSVDLRLSTGNFTIEFWLYLSATGAARGIVGKGASTTGWLVSTNSSNNVVFTYGSSTITSTGTLSASTWYHIAVVRSGTGSNQTKIYIDGTNDGTGTVSTDFTQTEAMYVGANRTGGDALNGYIDDLRITKGVARYTANFTPPTAAFPDL